MVPIEDHSPNVLDALANSEFIFHRIGCRHHRADTDLLVLMNEGLDDFLRVLSFRPHVPEYVVPDSVQDAVTIYQYGSPKSSYRDVIHVIGVYSFEDLQHRLRVDKAMQRIKDLWPYMPKMTQRLVYEELYKLERNF